MIVMTVAPKKQSQVAPDSKKIIFQSLIL